ncbi:MAG: rod shape-determining protein [Candidatus Izemoplasma sp.]|nr:rod shape-determining protein [Candidatus Izemoplasma sp.]
MAKNKKRIGIGIDLGTANLLVFLEQKGIIFNEPSVIAFDRESGKIVAAGTDAHKMLGKVHSKIEVIKPLKNGVISDMKAAKLLLRYVLTQIEDLTDEDLSNTSSVMCCPSEVTKIERDIIIELATNMGMQEVLIDEEIKSAALGSNIDIFESKGVMMVDIGGGTTDVGIMSYGDIVLSRTIRMAGNYIDSELAKYVKQKDKVEIGELTSEKAKINLADLREDAVDKSMRFAGRDIVRGVPKWVTITNEDVLKVITPIYEEIVKLISAVLKDTPPELSADIYKHGIYLTGGGSLVKGVEEFVKKRINVPVKVVPNPLTCVAEGSKYLLKNRGDYLVNPLKL